MFAIVTDSSAYLTRGQAERLGVRVLPMLYSVNGRAFAEGYQDENGRYKELIAQKRDLHTAQPPTASFLSAFNELLRRGHDVLCLTISSRLSGAYSSALMAAKELNGERILVVDSLSVAGGLRFLVEKAAELSRENKSLHEAADVLEGLREQMGIVFSVDDMEALRRSGRLGFVRQSVGTMLNLRPILSCKHGAVVSSGVARGTHAQHSALVESVPSDASKIVVHYIEKQPAALALLEALKKRGLCCPMEISEVGPVLAIHLGMHAIDISWVCTARENR